MKLVITIVQSADSSRLSDALVAKGFRSTRLSTVGGFLDEPNVTMLIGTEDEQLPELLALIRANCQARRRYMNAAPMSVETAGMPLVTASPIEVEVGGAAVFITPVRYRFRLGQSGTEVATGLSGSQAMLILAIVHPDESAGVDCCADQGQLPLHAHQQHRQLPQKGQHHPTHRGHRRSRRQAAQPLAVHMPRAASIRRRLAENRHSIR